MKEISNYLKEGLPSKIYLQAFPEPISRYRISKELYPIGRQTSSKIIEWSKKLINEGYLSTPAKDRILSNVEPLISEIKKEINISENEEKELSIFLNNDFRHFMKLIAKENFKNDVNAYKVLSEQLGLIAKLKNDAYQNKSQDLEKLPIPPNYNPPLKIIFDCKLDKNLLTKLEILMSKEIRFIFQIQKDSIDLHENFNKTLKQISG